MANLTPEHLREIALLQSSLLAVYGWLESNERLPAAMAGGFRDAILNAAAAQDLRGLRMLARDTIEMATSLTVTEGQALDAATRAAAGVTLREALAHDRARIDQVLRRGLVRNDGEYFMLRAYLDSAAGELQEPALAESIAAVLAKYRAT